MKKRNGKPAIDETNGDEASIEVNFAELFSPAEISAAKTAWDTFEPTSDEEGLKAALLEIVTDETLARIDASVVGPSIVDWDRERKHNIAAINLGQYISNLKSAENLHAMLASIFGEEGKLSDHGLAN